MDQGVQMQLSYAIGRGNSIAFSQIGLLLVVRSEHCTSCVADAVRGFDVLLKSNASTATPLINLVMSVIRTLPPTSRGLTRANHRHKVYAMVVQIADSAEIYLTNCATVAADAGVL